MATAESTRPARPNSQPVSAATSELKAAFSDFLQSGITNLAAKVSKTVDGPVDDLKTSSEPLGVTPDDGPTMNAGADAAQASVRGDNPVWAALKGAWSGASGKAKFVLWLIALLGVLLSPVLLVVLLLALIVLGIVEIFRAAAR